MFSKTQIFGVALATFVAVGLTACGSSGYCEDKETKTLFSNFIKETLIQEYPQFAEQITKIEVALGKITTLEINDKSGRASCSVDKISLKFDTGDTLFYDNNNSRFDYSARQSDKGIKINTNLTNKLTDIRQNISDYYLGFGVMIDGVRKGGCNGKQTFKDEKQGIVEHIECANGIRNGAYKKFLNDTLILEGNYAQLLKDGVWKWYDEKGVIQREESYAKEIADGTWKWYDEGGNLTQESNFKQGLKDGSWKWYEYGTLQREENYTQDIEDGVWKWYYADGQLEIEGSYKQGLMDGLWKWYDEIGNLQQEIGFKEGFGDGIWKGYFANGKLEIEGSYKEGLMDGIWKQYYENGKLARDEKYIQGLEDGAWKEYSENGEIQQESYFTQGLKTGVWKTYDNGFLVVEEPYKNDLLNGMSKTYYPLTKRVMFSINYTDGKENGVFSAYDKSGKLQTTIPYKNGIIDGVAKGCLALNCDLPEKIQKDLENSTRFKEQYSFGNQIGYPFDYIEFDNGSFTLARKKASELGKMYEHTPYQSEAIVLDNRELFIQWSSTIFEIKLYKNKEEIGGCYDERPFGLCEAKGKCEEMFKELINKSGLKKDIQTCLKQAK